MDGLMDEFKSLISIYWLLGLHFIQFSSVLSWRWNNENFLNVAQTRRRRHGYIQHSLCFTCWCNSSVNPQRWAACCSTAARQWTANRSSHSGRHSDRCCPYYRTRRAWWWNEAGNYLEYLEREWGRYFRYAAVSMGSTIILYCVSHLCSLMF